MVPIIVVEGGQNGSEAKGAVAAYLCLTRNVDLAVRTGAINAGHSVVYHGTKYAMQQLPTGWVNPNTKLVIGAGAYIHPSTLRREIDMVNAAMPDADVLDRLVIDFRCGIHNEQAEDLSKAANRHHLIGATGKGCSEAVVNKIRNRNNGCQLFRDVLNGGGAGEGWGNLKFGDTVTTLNNGVNRGDTILLEGTQGTLLDLHLGPYPFTTSRMTSAANWIAEAGLSPSLDYEVVLVCRTYPIRVAGNSGPMSDEIEWTDLARTINGKLASSGLPPKVSLVALMEFENAMYDAAYAASYPVPKVGNGGTGKSIPNIRLSSWTAAERQTFRVAASELHRDAIGRCQPDTVRELSKLFEMTTVTKKLRRVAELSVDDLRYAVAINRPSWLAMMFMDYVEPELGGGSEHGLALPEGCSKLALPGVHRRVAKYVKWVGEQVRVPVRAIGVGAGAGDILPWPAP